MRHSTTKTLALTAIRNKLKIPESSIERYIELTHLSILLEQLDIDLVLDVGANQGQFSSELRAIGYKGFIVAFEPVQSAYHILQKRFANDEHWLGYNFALGDESSTTQINVPCETTMSSLLDFVDENRQIEKQQVEVKKLDDIFDEITRAAKPKTGIFLKMDTQGYDAAVFQGACQVVSDGKIAGLMSELSVLPIYKNMTNYLDALSTYERAGFCIHNLTVVNRTSKGEILELNAFMKSKNMQCKVPRS